MSLKNFYFRTYAQLLALVLAVALICTGLFIGLNKVRQQAWQTHYPAAALHWLAEHSDLIGQMNDYLVYGSVQLVAADALSLDAVSLERLNTGQLLGVHAGDGIELLLAQNPTAVPSHAQTDGAGPRLVRAFFPDLYRGAGELSATLLAWQLDQLPESIDEDQLQKLASALNLRVSRVTGMADVPGQKVLNSLADEGFAWFRARPDSAAQVFLRLQDGSILSIDLPKPFNPWAWPILALLFFVIAGALGLAVYLLLSGLHQRLRGIENVVARIARGELDARVKTDQVSIVDRLGEAFNSMAEHIQRLVNVQREMIHAVSHELRTPVARIRFGVQMIEDCPGEEALHKQLTGIDADIQELDELIDEILTYARLEQGGPILAFQQANVSDIVNQVVREQQSIRPQLKIHAAYREGSLDWAESEFEERYIHRAIQNLVGNATRYAKSEVLVNCSFDRETCRVDVEDDGAGIPEADWDRVFTAFARLDDSRTRKSGGYGLGLSIVRRILFWHGGQAFAGRSSTLGGARFSLVWPRKQEVKL